MPDTELLHKPKAVQRIEVFTGTGRRRTWTAEQKTRIIAESYADGETVCAVARRHGLTAQQLFGWRRNARRRAQEGANIGSAFAPVIVDTAQPSCDAPVSPARPGGSAVIEIALAGATVRIPVGIDVATLKTVLRAVMAAT
jgi:transposase